MQQHKFAYNVKLINFMRIQSAADNSVIEIYLINAYNNKLTTTNNNRNLLTISNIHI